MDSWRFERIIVTLVPVLISATLVLSNVFWSLDRALYDLNQKLFTQAPNPQILIVAIDQQSINEIGRWPWQRSIHAQIVDKLGTAEAAAVGMDIVFSEPSTAEGDRLLVEAVSENGRVVLPIVHEQTRQSGQMIELLPFHQLAETVAQLGHVDRPLDSDSISRSVYLKAGLGEPHWPSFSLALLRVAYPDRMPQLPGLDRPLHRYESGDNRLPQSWQRDKQLWISYAGPPGHFNQVSYVDVLKDRIPREKFKDKIVIIGVTAAGQGDNLPTPVSGERSPMHGVEIIANELDTLLGQRGIIPFSIQVQALVTVCLVLLLVLALQILPARHALILLLGCILLTIVLSMALIGFVNRWFAPTAALTGMLSGYLLWSWRHLVHTVRHLNRTLSNLDREPSIFDKQPEPQLSRLMAFVSEIIPVCDARIRKPNGGVVESWAASLQDDQNITGSRSNPKSWHTFKIDSGSLDVCWMPKRSPSDEELRILRTLAQCYQSNESFRRHSPLERMERKIQQVENATFKLQEMRHFIGRSLAQMVDGVIVADNLGRVRVANQAACSMLGAESTKELYSETLTNAWRKLELGPGDDCLDILRAAIVHRSSGEIEASGADNRDLLVRIVPFEFNSKLEGVIIDIADVSAVRTRERNRREVLTFLSHDLRSPMASTLAAVELIRRNKQDSPDERYIVSIQENAERTLELVGDFLSLLGVEGARVENFEPVDLVIEIGKAVSQLKEQAEASDIKIVTEPRESAIVWGISDLLERLFENLIGNSIKYSPAGSVISISLKRVDKNFECSIVDNGFGIESADRMRIFERNERIRRPEHTRVPGSGLGLLFVKTVLMKHNGSIRVESKVNEGSTFIVSIPIPDHELKESNTDRTE